MKIEISTIITLFLYLFIHFLLLFFFFQNNQLSILQRVALIYRSGNSDACKFTLQYSYKQRTSI